MDDAFWDLAVTIHTIWRDLDTLQKAGFPLYTERAADGNHGVWRVTKAFKRALPVKLELGELAALLMSHDLLTPLGVSVLGPEAFLTREVLPHALEKKTEGLLSEI